VSLQQILKKLNLMKTQISITKTKTRIIKLLEIERNRLIDTLDRLTTEEFMKPGVVGTWSVKDVPAHLAHWEAGMPHWLQTARKRQAVTGPEKGLTWEQMTEFNQRIFEAHRDESLVKVMSYFHNTYADFMIMVEDMPEDELLTNGYHSFTEKKAVYDWLSQYAAHDRWAKTKIRAWMKARK
jgi:hypothetical protein